MAWSWNRIVWVLVLAFAALVTSEVFGATAISTGTIRLSEILAGPARDWDGDGIFDARGDE